MAYKYDTREGTHGVSYGAFTKIATTNEGALDTSNAPTSFTGLKSVNFETSQESTPVYADNVVHLTLNGAKTTEGTITCLQFPKKFVLDHLGKVEMANGGLVDTGKGENFAFQWIENVEDEFGKTYRVLNVYYNVKAQPPTGESTTDEDSADLKEFEIPVTATPNNLVLDTQGRAVTSMQLRENSTNSAIFELASTQLILPTTAVPGK